MTVLTIVLLCAVIITAIAFEYINGFHDSANAIAAVVSTKVLSPRTAVLYSAILNFIGAMIGVSVAKTIGAGIIAADTITLQVILCALIAAVIWNLITWWFGLPSSSSHALIGGLIGASVIHAGINCVNIKLLVNKVIIPMFASPVAGFLVGFTVMAIFLWIFCTKRPDAVNRKFSKVQIVASGMVALSHGMNDAQKTMGIITMALVTCGVITMSGEFYVPVYVKIICAITMALGTMSGGWKIIKTMGKKIIKMKPINGAAADFSSAAIIMTASHFGIPLSTTHIVSTVIMGVGSTVKAHAVKWGVVGNIVTAWVLTIPCCIAISAVTYAILKIFTHS